MPGQEENSTVNTTNYFEKLKQNVANSRYRKNSHCFSSANFMIELFSGQDASKMGSDWLGNNEFFQKSNALVERYDKL